MHNHRKPILPSITLRKEGKYLVPGDDRTQELFEHLANKTTITTTECFKVKDPLKHRRFMKMIRVAYDNLPEHEPKRTRDSFRREILIKAGWHVPMEVNQQIVYVAIDISNGAIDDRDFGRMFTDVFETINQLYGQWLPSSWLHDFY